MSDLDLIASPDSPFPPWVRDAAREARDQLRAIRPPAEPPYTPVEKMAYWANRVLSNDGALSADSSMDLDMAHDELTKAAREYLGLAP